MKQEASANKRDDSCAKWCVPTLLPVSCVIARTVSCVCLFVYSNYKMCMCGFIPQCALLCTTGNSAAAAAHKSFNDNSPADWTMDIALQQQQQQGVMMVARCCCHPQRCARWMPLVRGQRRRMTSSLHLLLQLAMIEMEILQQLHHQHYWWWWWTMTLPWIGTWMQRRSQR